jgi:hypothetical protein
MHTRTTLWLWSPRLHVQGTLRRDTVSPANGKPFSASNVEYGDGSTVRCYDADHPNGAESKDIHLRVKDLKWVKPSGLGDMYVSDSFDKAAERACCPLF